MAMGFFLSNPFGVFVLLLATLAAGAVIGALWDAVLLAPARRRRAQARVAEAEQSEQRHMAEKDDLMARMGRLRSAMSSEDKEIWLRYESTQAPELAPRIAQSIPIITMANLKGGVGKTTLCANLAAYFDVKWNKRVLLIDLDYQGSLSALTLNASGNMIAEETLTHHLIKGDKEPQWLPYAAQSLAPVLNHSAILPSFYDFATVENQVMLSWLLGDTHMDARFAMARYLLHPAVQSSYDLILMDCPPRLTTGVINALTCSTHVLIPTKLDRMSSQAVTTFVRQMREMRPLLFPELEILGVIGTMVDNSVSLTPNERGIWADMAADLPPQWRGPVHLFEGTEIPQKSAVAAASGSAFAYLQDKATRELIERLGDAITAQLDQSLERRAEAQTAQGAQSAQGAQGARSGLPQPHSAQEPMPLKASGGIRHGQR